jgi:hypothetical protein
MNKGTEEEEREDLNFTPPSSKTHKKITLPTHTPK